MIHEKVLLSDYFEIKSDAVMVSYVRENSVEMFIDRKRPSVLILPGGGYSYTSEREAEPVALKFVNAGFNAFVLYYTTSPARYPTQLIEASAALALIRRNAEKWNVIPDNIAVCGFSAGGHLAASVGTMWHEEFISEELNLSNCENKPNAMVLCYPVITGGEYAHRGSFNELLGEKKDNEDMIKYLSLENRVTSLCPPAFLWHTYYDNAVPVKNTLLMANALEENHIPFDLHIYQNGGHGLSLATPETATVPEAVNKRASAWVDTCTSWLAELFNFKIF